jgi:hypothetical protein
VYYEYFRERAASCRRSADGKNAWLVDVSLELADMYEEMAEESLARELAKLAEPSQPCVYRKNPAEDRPSAASQSASPARRYLFAVYNFVGAM